MKVLVGLSGGVDSSVTAALLKQAGHEVIGATMSIWDEQTTKQMNIHHAGCFSPHSAQDIAAAQAVCKQLDIPHYVIDCASEYKQKVLDLFRLEYINGKTPNPCVLCNEFIKFDALPTAAIKAGIQFDKFATGHYASVFYNDSSGRWCLQRGQDEKKDQTYFIYRLKQEQLSRLMMPLGPYTKEQVRQMAQQFQLPVKDKADSQDFYTGDLNDIIQATPKIGNFVTPDGRILGTHHGIWNYTVGQRKGLGISADRPLYVLKLNAEKNEVVVGYAEDGIRTGLSATNLSWLSIEQPETKITCLAKVRSTQTPVPITLSIQDDKAQVSFQTPQSAVANGQSVVFYDNNGLVLGGGLIDNSF